MLISTIIVAAIVIINPEIVTLSSKGYVPREAITLEEALLNELSPSGFAAQWLPASSSDDNLYKTDQLLFEDSKNLEVLTLMPSSEPQVNKHPLTNQASGLPASLSKFQPNITTLISNTSLLSSIEYQGFKLSPSKRYLLIWTAKKKQFRHSFTAKYFLYDIELDLISLLSTQRVTGGELLLHNSYEHLDSASQYLNNQANDRDDSRFQIVSWFSANEDERDSLILVQNNDIFILNSVAGNQTVGGQLRQQQAPPTRITFTGKTTEIFNGIPDWLYEEEILSDSVAFQVSPKATTLAYMSFNDSLVDLMPFSIYGPSEQVVPRTQQIRYSKAGRVNPRVSVHVVDLSSERRYRDTELTLPDDLGLKQHYISRIAWLSEERLALVWLNRNQNESYIVICSRPQGWRCEKNLHLTSPGGWLDLSEDLRPLDDEYYITLLFKDEGDDVGSFKNVAKISMSQSNTYTFLTSGRREVDRIDSVDRKRRIVYFTANTEAEPGQRQVYYVDADGSGKETCLTCDHHPDECLYNSVRISPSSDYYIFDCDGPGVPRTELRTTRFGGGQRGRTIFQKLSSRRSVSGLSLNQGSAEDNLAASGSTEKSEFSLQPESSLLWTIEDNHALKAKLKRKAMPLTMRLKVPIRNTNYSANVIMILPPQLGSSATFGTPSAASRFGKRSRRSAAPFNSGIEQPLHSHFTPNSIVEYTSQLPGGQQFPMVVDVYAGPGSQKVDYRYNINFGYYMASSRRTIYVMIDGRGSGFQGTKRLYELYHKFGTVEIEDQIEVAAYLTRSYLFIDPNKVAIWGWSYGGYAAAMVLAKSNSKVSHALQETFEGLKLSNSSFTSDSRPKLHANNPTQSLNGVFECAVSVAPVTNWIYYDTAYTERYMSSPYLSESYDRVSGGDHYLSNVVSPVQMLSLNHDSGLTNKWQPLKSSFNRSLANLVGKSRLIGKKNLSDLNERYKAASLLDNIANIDKRRFLLVHGTADDNVHFQQSIMLMKRMIQSNIMFETGLYPDQDHGISSRADKLHLGSTLSNFFSECFDLAY